MGDDHVLHAPLGCLRDQLVGLLVGNMAGGQDDVVLGDDVQGIQHILLQVPLLVQAGDGGGLDPRLLHLQDDPGPEGQLLVGVPVEGVGPLVRTIASGEPDQLGPAAGGHLHSRRVDAP